MADATNTVVMNQGLNPLVNYNFMLRVEGVFDLPCKAVHSFTKENEYEYIQEGGLNDYVHMRRKPISKPFTFTVERYVGTDYYDPLQNGTELVLPLILLVTRHGNHFEVTKRAYVFTGCTVMSKEYGELNSEQSGLHTERIVIGYREMMVVTMPVDIGIGQYEKDDKTKNKFAKEPADTGKATRRVWPEESSANEFTSTGKAAIRKWPEESSARKQEIAVDENSKYKELVEKRKKLMEDLLNVYKKNKEQAERRKRIRRYPKVRSAKLPDDTGKAVARNVLPITAPTTERPEARTVLPIKAPTSKKKKSRRWPSESSAKKL